MIEKLGITPGWFPGFNWICNDKGKGKNGVLFECDEDCTVKDFIVAIAAPEMLHALINIGLYGALANEHDWPKIQYVIEKATGRSWEEVKKIIEGEET